MVPWLRRLGELCPSGRIDTASERFAKTANRAVVQFFNGTNRVNIGISGNLRPFVHLASFHHGTRQTATCIIGLQGSSVR